MTLFKQIAIKIAVIFVLLLVALIYNNFMQTTRFIQGQMQSIAHDMVTTLGVTIANGIDVNDKAAIDTLFNTIFDSGYYSHIELRSMDGTPIAMKERDIEVSGVPRWFQKVVSIEPAVGTTQIIKGWVQYGELRLILHPGYAYAELYAVLTGMLFWFGVLGGISYITLWVLLRWFLQPLKRVQEQAEAIHDNRFIRQEKLPRTKELRQVVVAMNRMIDKVEAIVTEQADTLRRYHSLLYVDDVTNLSNRRYLLMRLKEILQDETNSMGMLVLISLQNLELVQQRDGGRVVDYILRTIAGLIESVTPSKATAMAARLNDDQFAIYLSCDENRAKEYIEEIFSAFRGECEEKGVALNAGIASIQSQSNIAEILWQADFALNQAKACGIYQLHTFHSDHDEIPHDKLHLREWLDEALNSRRFFMVAQSIKMADDSVFHRELFIRLRNDMGDVLTAGRIMPIATSLGMESSIDREVFRMLLGLDKGIGPIAINLSGSVLSSTETLAEFEQFMRSYKQRSVAPLYIEFNHVFISQNKEVVNYIAERIRHHGYYFGIDNFNFGDDLEVIRELRPRYIKIAATKLYDMTSDGKLGAFQSLTTLAVSLDIQLIAVGIDSAELHHRIKQLESVALQGNYLEEPLEL
ncbi:MAG: EAL domain-containing protein [Chromatiales bacterium]|nr:EAL domain-containing protein [Chromatiales bacterium]